MTSQQARELAIKSQSEPLKEIFTQIQESAKKGFFSCYIKDADINDAIVFNLRQNGFVVRQQVLKTPSGIASNGIEIMWEC